MQQYSIYLPVIIQGTIGVLTLLVSGLFYFNYSREKAKNQATKEDIKEITREVESAKKEFIDKTEQLKAELSLANQHKLSWKIAEREAIIDYNQKIYTWINSLFTVNLLEYNYENYKDLMKIVDSYKNVPAEISVSEGRLNLFINDSEFRVLTKQLITDINEYGWGLCRISYDIHDLYLSCKKNVENHEPRFKDALVQDTNKTIIEIRRTYYEVANGQERNILDLQSQLTEMLREKLGKIA